MQITKKLAFATILLNYRTRILTINNKQHFPKLFTKKLALTYSSKCQSSSGSCCNSVHGRFMWCSWILSFVHFHRNVEGQLESQRRNYHRGLHVWLMEVDAIPHRYNWDCIAPVIAFIHLVKTKSIFNDNWRERRRKQKHFRFPLPPLCNTYWRQNLPNM